MKFKITLIIVLIACLFALNGCSLFSGEVTLTFESNGGSAVASIEVAKNQEVELPIPTREDFSFGGWYYNSALSDKVDESHTFKKNTKLYAKWIPDVFQIIYENTCFDWSYNPNPETYTIVTPTITIQEISKNGATFMGWFEDEDFTVEADLVIPTGSRGNKTFYAKWDLEIFTITYILNDGEFDILDYPETFTVDTEEFKLPTELSKDGYVFSGWYTTMFFGSLSRVDYVFQGTYNNFTLYARWLDKYNITYNLAGGENHEDNIDYFSVETEIILQTPAKPGFNFGGWYTSNTFEAEDYLAVIPLGTDFDIELYANWVDENLLFNEYNSNEYRVGYTPSPIDESVTFNVSIPKSYLGKSVTMISDYGFNQRKYISKIEIPEGIREIGYYAFYGTKYQTITLPSTIEEIGDIAFSVIEDLEELYVLAEIPPIIGDMSNFHYNSSANIYVPADSVDAYKTAPGWEDYADYIFAIVPQF